MFLILAIMHGSSLFFTMFLLSKTMVNAKYMTFLIIVLIVCASAGIALGTEILADYENPKDKKLIFSGMIGEFAGYLTIIIMLILFIKKLVILKKRAAMG